MSGDVGTVTFRVECTKTQPGESVYVVGGHTVLGNWATENALPLTTNAATFPVWESEKVTLPCGQKIEFKYAILPGKSAAAAKWEGFPGNRSVEVAPGTMVTVTSAWDNANTTTTATRCDIGDKLPPMPAGLVKEDGTLNRTMSGCRIFQAEMEVLTDSLEKRDAMRRNFSQTLLNLHEPMQEDPTPPQAGASMAAPVDGQVIMQSAIDDDNQDVAGVPEAPHRGVALSHIASFSALTEMVAPEVKTATRKQRKGAQYAPFNLNAPVVIVTSEIAPYSKSGGLGLVAASYSYEFARNGHRTMAISPKYKHFDGIQYLGETRVRVAGQDQLVKYWHMFKDFGDGKGCDYVFVDHPCIERGAGLYNDDSGREYPDNLLRFTLLSAAAMEAPLVLHPGGYPYGDKVVFIANDWQAGLVPLYLCYKYRKHNVYSQARCMYVIHNLGYQGQYHGVEACEFFNIDHQAAGDLVFGNCINLSKGALICADRVLTVSPNYAHEIQTREGGFALEDYVRGKAHGLRLCGILNGIDDVWNPDNDSKIHKNFSVDDFIEGKRANKEHLQKMLGLSQDPNACVIGFVGRLTWQKGVDVIAEIIQWLMDDTGNGVTGRAQLILMGNGEEQYASSLRWAENTFRGRACGYVGFDPKVEHQLMAGCDLFLMPSRYEPCGLPQMYSQQYGTLPVVHATGGLVDSVVDLSAGLDKATGFMIPYMSVDRVKEVLYKAMELFHHRPEDFKQMQHNAMMTDFYWPQAMDQYEQNIDYLLYDPPCQR